MKWLRRILIGLVVVFMTATVVAWLWLRGTLPQIDGTITVAGLNGEVEVLRDANGVPHITATSEADAYFGLGFVHAQDRLWQMELPRHAARGRLALLFGAAALPHDRHFRALGLPRVAARNLERLSARNRALLDAYAAGVNAYLDSHSGAYALELAILRITPERWTAIDSILAVKMMAVQLSGNAADELMRAKLLRRLSPAQVATLYPGKADVPQELFPDHAEIGDALLRRTLAALPPAMPPGIGSNNWAVAGRRSASGAPILANDPHLGLQVPAYWYLVHLRAPQFNVVGATIPGIPSLIVGRNQAVAWGVTNTGPDVQDLVVVTAADVTETREEIIAVAGGEAVTLIVRETAYGPIVSDSGGRFGAGLDDDQALALAWTALADDDVTVQAGFGLARATSVAVAREALRDFHAPQQNFLLADTAGHIAFIAAGRVPLRQDHIGWLPVVAADGKAAWRGHIPFDELPQALDPESGALFTANQDITAPGYAHFLTRDWPAPYRPRRIQELLGSRERHSAADFAAMQTDVVSVMARDFLPILLAGALSPRGERVRPMLTGWDAAMDAARPEPLIFHAWYRELARTLFADELGEDFARFHQRRPLAVWRMLTRDTSWCDDVASVAVETCETQIAAALDDALDWIEARFGTDPDAWRWGDVHVATSRHLIFSRLAAFRALFEIVRVHDGGPYTVMQGNTRISDDEQPFAEIHGASLRTVFDLADADSTRAIIHTGQSAHRLSPHYDDLADRWQAGELLSLPLSEAAVAAAAVHRLRLVPR